MHRERAGNLDGLSDLWCSSLIFFPAKFRDSIDLLAPVAEGKPLPLESPSVTSNHAQWPAALRTRVPEIYSILRLQTPQEMRHISHYFQGARTRSRT